MKKGYLSLLLILTIAVTTMLSGCTGKTEDARNVVYDDMKASFEQSGLLSSNIGLFSRTEEDGAISYGECGSGVIIDNRNGEYYALTCAHVVSVDKAELLVFTTNTDMKSENIPGMSVNTLSKDAYDSMHRAETVFVSDRDDLAVIRFACDEDLSVIELAEADPKQGDRIMCIGNPQNEWFSVSYGKVTSDIERVGEIQGFPSNAMRHSAYMHVGSSGGAALNEQMQLIGITPGGSYSLDGKDFNYGYLIPVSEIKLCLEDWNRQ